MLRASNLLVVAAHPDDEVLGAGGTIPLVKQAGGRVTVLIVTDGSSTQYAGDSAVAARKEEQLALANRLLGVDEVLHWDFPDMRLDTVAHVELNRRLDELVRARGFDTVLTHHHGDVNLDHQMIYRSVLVVARGVPDQPIERLFTFHVGSSTEWGLDRPGMAFVPNLYVDITSTITTKVKALEAYVDETRPYPHPRSAEAVEAVARSFGVAAGFAFAEPFRLVLARERPASAAPTGEHA